GTIVPPGTPRLPAGIPARAWIRCELGTGDILAARDPHGRYQPASILKMLTALTVVEHLPGNRVVTVSPQAAAAEGSAVGLLPGGRYTVDQLFAAMLLVSGNDAAAALAQANGGTAATVAQMNAEAVALGAYDTYVQTPSGLDGWQQLTSAYDMALVLRATLQQPRLLRYDQLRSASYPPRASSYGAVGPYQFDNQSNSFFDTVPGALLAKIGYTDAAQHTYLAAARRDGRTLGLVFLRDTRYPLDQYQQAARLFDWGFALKPGTSPVGRLAGPIAAAAPATASSAPSAQSQRATVPAVISAAGADPIHRSRPLLIVVGTAALAIGGLVAAGRQLSRRRLSRLR
ncbi:MAG TPA: serine hydrolase, partial [Jatrophihabitans sp.]|nr:serine hydrolase [Jatrophihabitans sp.]